jgi:hypothetical protein
MDICLLLPPYQEITDRAKRSDEENDQPPCELAPAHLAWIAPNEIDKGNKYQDELKNGEREQEGKPRTEGNSARILYEEQEGNRHCCVSFFRLYIMRKSCLTSTIGFTWASPRRLLPFLLMEDPHMYLTLHFFPRQGFSPKDTSGIKQLLTRSAQSITSFLILRPLFSDDS